MINYETIRKNSEKTNGEQAEDRSFKVGRLMVISDNDNLFQGLTGTIARTQEAFPRNPKTPNSKTQWIDAKIITEDGKTHYYHSRRVGEREFSSEEYKGNFIKFYYRCQKQVEEHEEHNGFFLLDQSSKRGIFIPRGILVGSWKEHVMLNPEEANKLGSSENLEKYFRIPTRECILFGEMLHPKLCKKFKLLENNTEIFPKQYNSLDEFLK